MLRTSCVLVKKIPLTHNIFELTYHCPQLAQEPPKAGQYVMFQLAPRINRAYSIATYNESSHTFSLIIKRITEGKGSPSLCDAELGTEFFGIIPLGNFVLRDTPNNKCFIGTGT